MSTLYENYTTGNDNFSSVYTGEWRAQGFTAMASHNITSVKILAYRQGNAGTLTLSIRATSSGVPTGSDLVSGTLDVSGITTDSAGQLIEVTFSTPLDITNGTVYAVVCHASGADSSNRLKWNIQTTGAYAGGAMATSNDGSSWSGATTDGMFQIYGDAIPLTTNIVSYWKLDEANGNAADAVGSNTLTNNNTVTYSAGKINNGANFASASSQSLSIADASQTGLDITGDLTISGWVNFASLGASFDYVLFSKWVAASRAYNIELYDAGGGVKNIHISINSVDKDVAWAGVTTATWYFLTIVYTASSGSVKVYVNGTQNGSDLTGFDTSINNSTSPFVLGGRGDFSTYLNGSEDEVGVWNRALTSTEITTLYNNGAGNQYPFSSTSTVNSNFLMFM